MRAPMPNGGHFLPWSINMKVSTKAATERRVPQAAQRPVKESGCAAGPHL